MHAAEPTMVSLACVDPISDPLWRRLVQERASSVFHSPEWMQVLVDTYKLQIDAYLLLDAQGVPRAGMPFCRIEDMTGKRLVTLPFSDYCDPLVDDAPQWELLAGKLLAERVPVLVRSVHCDLPARDKRFKLTKQAMWHAADLRPDLDTIWRGIPDAARRATRKAERNGVTVQVASDMDSLRAFFEMYLRLRKHKYRLIAQPYAFFQNIWQQFVEQKKGFLLAAYYEGQMIAGIFFLEWKDALCYKFNASIPETLAHRPNNLLIWEGIKLAKAAGYTQLDFGLSDLDQEGLLRYKRQFATQEKTISFLQYRPDDDLTTPEQELRALLPELTDLFTSADVPDSVTEKAGEVLYKFFA